MFADNKLSVSVKCLLSLFIAWLGLRNAVAARQRGQASTPAVRMRVLRRHPAWFRHSEPMTSNCGLLPLLPPPRATREARDIRAELLPASLPASVDASS